MSIISRSADLVYTLRFLRLLTTEWTDMKAYEMGIIDENGNRTNKRITTSEEKSVYNTFHRLVFSLKRLLNKAPGGRSKIASYAASLFLIKEHTGMTDEGLMKLLDKVGVSGADIMEETTQWYVTRDEKGPFLSPGVYKLREEKLLNRSCEPMARRHDQI